MTQTARRQRTEASESDPPPRPARALDRRGDTWVRSAIAVERTTRPRPLPAPDQLRFGQVFSDHMFQVDYREGRWRNARIVPFGPLALSPAASGLHYGQAMIEGLKAFRGVDGKVRIFRLDRHCRRLASGAARMCMPPPPAELLEEAVRLFVDVDRSWVPEAAGTALYLRPTFVATEPFLGVRPATEYLLYVIASPGAAYFGAGGPLRLKVEERLVRAAPGGLGAVKAAGNYGASLLAAEQARAEGFDQVVWTDAGEHSAIEEAGMMNVFAHLDDEIATPPLDGTILAGVNRDAVIALLRGWGHRMRQRRITMEQIVEARRTGRLHEMWGCGTGAGVAPIGELGWRGERIVVGDGGEGPIARRLGSTLRDIQTGAAPDPEGWMALV